jgi:hypothetical protein
MEAMRVIDRSARTITIVFSGELFCLLLIGVLHIHNAVPKASLAVSSSAVLALAIRAGFSHVLILEPQRVTARTLLRTRSWNYGDLRWAGVSGTKRPNSRSFIVLELKTGKSYSFTAYSEQPDSPSLTARAAREINARIQTSGAIFPQRI